MTVDAVIAKYSATPFHWGKSDCCTFVRECLEADGKRYGAMRIRWSDEKSAQAIIDRYGSLIDALTDHFGEPMIPEYAQRGDIAVVEHDGQQICAYVTHTIAGRRCVVRTMAGITDWPVSRAVAIWRP